jgi:hypothetical protein
MDKYKKLGLVSLLTKTEKKALQNDILYQLHRPVPPDEYTPHYKEVKKNVSHQADILFLPTDKFGYKYCLVITDIYSRITDAIELKYKDADSVLKGAIKIYNRGILPYPLVRIIVDDGNEFYGEFEQYFKKRNILVKHLPAGKHLGIVDSKIKVIGTALFHQMEQVEYKTNKVSKAWVKNLPEVITLLNEYTVEMKQKTKDKNPGGKDTLFPHNNKLLEIGTKVRYALFKPKDILGTTQSGKFRATDVKWSKDIHTVDNILLIPDSPVMYIINGFETEPFTREKLQITT